jgi:hypothetical protein
VRDFEVVDIQPYAVNISYERDGEAITQQLFAKGDALPSTKMVSFARKESFGITAAYAEDERLPARWGAGRGSWQAASACQLKGREVGSGQASGGKKHRPCLRAAPATANTPALVPRRRCPGPAPFAARSCCPALLQCSCPCPSLHLTWPARPLLPCSISRQLATFQVGPFSLPSGQDKAKLKVRVRLNLHGLVGLEGVQTVEEKEVEVSSRAPWLACARLCWGFLTAGLIGACLCSWWGRLRRCPAKPPGCLPPVPP